MRKDTDEQLNRWARVTVGTFIKIHGKDLDDQQKAALREKLFPIAMREELETREAVAQYGVFSTLADDECLRVWHRSFRDMSAVAAKYGIDTGFEKISKNWQF